LGDLLASEDAFLEELAQVREKSGLLRRKKGEEVLIGAAFHKTPLAMRRRLVRRSAARLEPKARGLSFEGVEGILAVWEGRVQGPRDVGYGLRADRRKGLLYLGRGKKPVR
jgi:hypothetical protein